MVSLIIPMATRGGTIVAQALLLVHQQPVGNSLHKTFSKRG